VVTTISAYLDSEPATLNIGSPAAVILDLPLFQPASIGSFVESATSVSLYYKEGFNLQFLIAYAQEIWQRTAAKGQANAAVGSGAVHGTGSMASGGNEFVAIQFTSSAYPTNRRFVDGTPPIVDCGWVAFTYGGTQGRLQRINFQNQVFFPESSNSDGFNYFLWPHAAGSFYGTTKNTSGVPLKWSPGSSSNLASNDTSGLHYDGPNVSILGGPQTNTLTVPVQDSSLYLQNHSLLHWMDTRDGITHTGDFALWTALLSYLVETWQNVACPQSADPSVVFHAISGADNFFNADYPYVSSGFLTVTAAGNGVDEDFGATGIRQFGYFAAVHGSFMGELQYWNSTDQFVCARGPDPTGWWVCAKDDVVGELAVYGTARRCHGVQTPYGDISFADGVYSGLLW
jgi:hypothetical protein